MEKVLRWFTNEEGLTKVDINPYYNSDTDSDEYHGYVGINTYYSDTDSNEYADAYLELLEEIDRLMKTPEGISPVGIGMKTVERNKMCQMLLHEFNAKSFVEAFQAFEGIQKEASLMVLQQLLPDLAAECAAESKLPLEKFRSNSKIANYLDAVIKSGVAADIDHGIVFLVGNTGVGKTSLANTLKAYVENPTDNPSPILAGTGRYKDLIETQVLEVLKDVEFQQKRSLGVKVTNLDRGPCLVDFKKDEATQEENQGSKKSIKIRLVDMGGHKAKECKRMSSIKGISFSQYRPILTQCHQIQTSTALY